MVLRSVIRINKGLVLPFISCIIIMFTLLVLIHKSSDELNTVEKELGLCKQQQDSLYTQLQSAINQKLHSEKLLEELKASLTQEKEDRKKDKEEADSRYNALKIFGESKENKLQQFEEEKNKLNEALKKTRENNERVLASKDKLIEELQDKLKNLPQGLKKVVPDSDNNQPEERMDLVHPGNSTTPNINPMAVNQEDSVKQVVAPPPIPQPSNDHDNLQKDMRQSLNLEDGVRKPEENVMKAPQLSKNEDEKQEIAIPPELEKVEDGEKNGYLPMPLNFIGGNRNNVRSSVSNNAAEKQNRPEDQIQQQVLPFPISNDKNKKDENPRNMIDDVDDDKIFAEDDGEEGEELDNNDVAAPKKGKIYNKDKNLVE